MPIHPDALSIVWHTLLSVFGTYVVFLLVSQMWNTISPLINFVLSFLLPKTSAWAAAKSNPFYISSNFLCLQFGAYTKTTNLLALVFLNLTHLNSLPFGFGLPISLKPNSPVLCLSPLMLVTALLTQLSQKFPIYEISVSTTSIVFYFFKLTHQENKSSSSISSVTECR